jgi:hypothetical protein
MQQPRMETHTMTMLSHVIHFTNCSTDGFHLRYGFLKPSNIPLL